MASKTFSDSSRLYKEIKYDDADEKSKFEVSIFLVVSLLVLYHSFNFCMLKVNAGSLFMPRVFMTSKHVVVHLPMLSSDA